MKPQIARKLLLFSFLLAGSLVAQAQEARWFKHQIATLCGLPMGRRFRPYFAWYGDMELFPHLWEAFSLGPIEIHVEYHKPVTIREVGNRKALALYCETKCREGVVAALSGRRLPEVVEAQGHDAAAEARKAS